MAEGPTTTWMNAGDGAFYCIVEGRIAAVLYWQAAAPAESGEPGGEPVVLDAEWGLVHADDPENHVMLGVDDRADEPAALDAAGRAVIGRQEGK